MIGAILGYKGNQAAAKQAQAVGEFNARIAENEAKILQTKKTSEDANLRKASERTIATQRVATAASGIEMSGSALEALKDSYMNTQMDALNLAFRWKHQGRTDFRYEYQRTIESLAKSYDCKNIIITADLGSSSYRKEINPEYKQNRKEKFAEQSEAEKMAFEEFILYFTRI